MVRLWLVVAYIHYRWMRLKDHEWGGDLTYFRTLPQHSLGWAEENPETPQLEQLVTQQSIEPSAF